jgi:hypothetical protein
MLRPRSPRYSCARLQPWFLVALGAWLANSLLAVLVVKRRASATAAAAGRTAGNAITPAIDALRRSPAWDVAQRVMLANDLAMLYLMFNKPSLAESCGVVAVAILLSVGKSALSWRRRDVNGRAGAVEAIP